MPTAQAHELQLLLAAKYAHDAGTALEGLKTLGCVFNDTSANNWFACKDGLKMGDFGLLKSPAYAGEQLYVINAWGTPGELTQTMPDAFMYPADMVQSVFNCTLSDKALMQGNQSIGVHLHRPLLHVIACMLIEHHDAIGCGMLFITSASTCQCVCMKSLTPLFACRLL